MRRILIAMMTVGFASGFAAAQELAQTCRVQDYGAKGDGVTVDTAAIQKAIDDCGLHPKLSSHVVLLGGAAKFVSGPLVLRSNITLRIAAGTTLEGSTNHEDYPEIEVFREPGRQSLLSARGEENIAIDGGGAIDGRGESWWPHREPGYKRPRLIVFDHCKHIRMSDVTVQNSPSWQIVPYYSEDVEFKNMKILAPTPDGHNTDGIDPFSSKHVLIDHVLIDTGDDNVAIKSGQPGSVGPDDPSVDITVRDCVFLHGHGLSVGSEVAGGVQHVRVERVTFKGTVAGVRIKSGRDRGNDIGDFVYKDLNMQDVATPIQVTEYYGGDKSGAAGASLAPVTRLTPHFHDIRIENVKATGAKVAMDIEGLPEAPVKGLVLRNIQIQAARGAKVFYAEIQSEGLAIQPQSGPPVIAGAGAKGLLK